MAQGEVTIVINMLINIPVHIFGDDIITPLNR
jgi:hypothetical protein